MVEIIYERPLDAVVKEYPDHAEPPGKGGMFLLNYLALAPAEELQVLDLVAQFQI